MRIIRAMTSSRRPLQVYLDSNDFSNLSDPVKREPFVEVERQLLVWRDAGLIDLRFSFVHVAEFAPLSSEALQFARRRAECIARLCGSMTFIAHGDLIELEVKALSNGSVLSRVEVLDDQGNWMPRSFRDDLDLPPLHQTIAELVEDPTMNRAQRRAIKHRYVGDGGRLRPSARTDLNRQLPAALEDLRRSYPMTEKGIRAAKRYYLGTLSKSDVEEMIIGSVRDVQQFMDWYSGHWDTVNPTTEWLRKEGAKMLEWVAAGMALRERWFALEELIGTPQEALQKRILEPFVGMPLRLVESMVRRRLQEEGLSVTTDEAIRYLPGTWSAARTLAEVLQSTMGRIKTPRKGKRSDFGDGVHCIYLPYVDVFRADGFLAPLIKATKPPFQTTIVGDLNELPAAIEAKLC